jgi:hypothetical protein
MEGWSSSRPHWKFCAFCGLLPRGVALFSLAEIVYNPARLLVM